jgi:uncharacterized protein
MFKIQKFILLILSIIILLQSNSCGRGGNSSGRNDYLGEMNKFRAEKNNFFKNNPHSPLPDSIRATFDSLNYFPINPGLRIIAEYLPIHGRNTLTVPLNNGQSQLYLKHGFATFVIDSIPHSLLVLKSLDNNSGLLFLPFYDKTNGFETYGGGRYLEPLQISDSKILLDFNKAYNPYCVYSPEYVCPLPPRENILQIPVTAGEKSFEIH